ncbi:2-hydroxycarboxylate transporter family protein, partial [Virgibacillus salexigens]|uniref:2-hydroxycarboxylate transporter family protein n=1 Tax=Virgibacillus salexigens TaxID=61016 RepID=UPI0030812B97
KVTYNVSIMGVGMLAALEFYVLGQILGNFIPLHPYALMIILVAIFKLAGWLPVIVENGENQWYQFVAKNWTLALLIEIGIAYTDLNAVIDALTIEYILLVASVVIGAALGAAMPGKLVGFHPIASANTAGLC